MDFFKDEINVYDFLKNDDKPVIIYGMGDGADKVISQFKIHNIDISGVMASDDFVRGQKFHNFTVKKLSDFENMFDEFNIALCFASQIPEVISHIMSIAKKHTVVVPSVPVFGETMFDNAFINKYSKDFEKAYNLLADDMSKKVFENTLKFYFSGELSLLNSITTTKEEAFNNILRLNKNETYVDLGAYNGDTIEEFLQYSDNQYNKIIALEPNAKNFEKLKSFCNNMDKVDLWQLGSYNKNTTLTFNNKAGRNSAISSTGVMTNVITVDSLLCGMKATYIKADVEGADFETLEGMKNTLKTFKPKLNFSAYHRFEDIFRLPIYIDSLNSDYKIYLRHHPYIPAWDTNIYCV